MSVLRFLASVRFPALDCILTGISMIGTPVVILGLISWIYWNVDKDKARSLGVSFFLSGLIGQGIKVMARVPRPWNLDTSFAPVSIAVSTATGYSFPSIHAQSTASFTSGIFYYNKKRSVRLSCVLFLAVIVFSRMYLGVHTPMDVTAGSILGIAGSLTILPLLKRYGGDGSWRGWICTFLPVALAALLVVLSGFFVYNATVSSALAKDSFETAGSAVGFAVSTSLENAYFPFQEKGSARTRALRLLLGISGVSAIEFGLKALLGNAVPFLVLRYFLIGMWLFTCTPVIGLKAGLFEKA